VQRYQSKLSCYDGRDQFTARDNPFHFETRLNSDGLAAHLGRNKWAVNLYKSHPSQRVASQIGPH